jgi:hypothetical protein
MAISCRSVPRRWESHGAESRILGAAVPAARDADPASIDDMTHTTTPATTTCSTITPRRRGWLLAGALAGLTGMTATMVTDLHPSGTKTSTPEVVHQLSQPMAHAGVVAGFLTVTLLLVVAAAWRRHVEPRVPHSTAARVVSAGMTASAATLALGYGWKGALAIYLPGGLDAGLFDATGLYIYFVLTDFGGFIGWLGACVAAGAMAWMAFRERTISRWIGAVSIIPAASVCAYTGLTGLPGSPGLATPLWTTIAFLSLAFGRSTIMR